jgi:hypothetical protein
VNGDNRDVIYGLKSSAKVPMPQDPNPCITPVVLDARSAGQTQVKAHA